MQVPLEDKDIDKEMPSVPDDAKGAEAAAKRSLSPTHHVLMDAGWFWNKQKHYSP